MMWPFRKKIKCYCPECGNTIKFLYGEVRLEQTKKGMNIILPSPIECKNCKQEVELPPIRIKNDGSINFGG